MIFLSSIFYVFYPKFLCVLQILSVFFLFVLPPYLHAKNGIYRENGHAFCVCVCAVASAKVQRAEAKQVFPALWPLQKCRGLRRCRGCFCIFAENKEIHGVQGAVAGLSLHCPGVGTVQGHA